MKVEDIMTTSVRSCNPHDSLAEAARIMWDYDCGVVPIVDESQKVLNVVTDRDICMAVARNHHRPEETRVTEITGSKNLYTCRVDDGIGDILETMSEHQIRRMPVIDDEDHLQGMISINDIVLAARKKAGKRAESPTYEEVVDAFKSICEHHHAEPNPIQGTQAESMQAPGF